MRTWLVATAAAVSIALGLALAACGSSGHPAVGSTENTPDPSGRSRLEAVVQCLRAHGVQNFPDPVYDPSDGRWHYADYRQVIPQRSQQACQHLDPSAVRPSPPVPQAQLTELVRLARCIRRHGLPTWPDPNPQGQFRLPPSQLAKSPLSANAVQACRRYIPSGGIDVVNASAP